MTYQPLQQGEGSGLDADTLDGHVVTVQSAEPAGPSVDDIWFDTTNAAIKAYDGSAWTLLGGSGTDTGDGSGSTTLVESFEEASPLSNYTGSTGNYTITSGLAGTPDGANALRGGDGQIISTAGLPVYPSQGDTFEVWYRTRPSSSSAGYPEILFGVEASNSYLSISLTDETLGSAGLNVYSQYPDGAGGIAYGAGNSTTGLALSAATWYKYEVVWASTVTVTLYEADETTQLAQLSFNPSADATVHTSGGIGFIDYSGTNVGSAFDGIRIQ